MPKTNIIKFNFSGDKVKSFLVQGGATAKYVVPYFWLMDWLENKQHTIYHKKEKANCEAKNTKEVSIKKNQKPKAFLKSPFSFIPGAVHYLCIPKAIAKITLA